MTSTSEKTPIPQDIWTPLFIELGFTEATIAKILRNQAFDQYAHKHGTKVYCSPIGIFYEETIETILDTKSNLQFHGAFFRDGSMYGLRAHVEIFQSQNKLGSLYAASPEIAKRLNLDENQKGASIYWLSKEYNIEKIVESIHHLKLYDQRMDMLYQMEANRLADLAEILVPK